MNAERRHSEGATARELAGRPGPIVVTRIGVCVECGRHTPAPDARHCLPCIEEYLSGLKRRQDAELRLQPLSDFLEVAC